MRIYIEVSYSLKRFFKENNWISLVDCEKHTIADVLTLCSIPRDEVGIIIINDIKSSCDDIVSDGDKIKLFPPIVAG